MTHNLQGIGRRLMHVRLDKQQHWQDILAAGNSALASEDLLNHLCRQHEAVQAVAASTLLSWLLLG